MKFHDFSHNFFLFDFFYFIILLIIYIHYKNVHFLSISITFPSLENSLVLTFYIVERCCDRYLASTMYLRIHSHLSLRSSQDPPACISSGCASSSPGSWNVSSSPHPHSSAVVWTFCTQWRVSEAALALISVDTGGGIQKNIRELVKSNAKRRSEPILVHEVNVPQSA